MTAGVRKFSQLSIINYQPNNGGMPWTRTTLPSQGSPLFSKQVRLARPVDIPKTPTTLHWENWCHVKDLHPQPPRSERGASASWANAALTQEFAMQSAQLPGWREIAPSDAFRILHSAFKWHSRQESHLQPPRSKRGTLMIELREQKI